MIWRRRSSRGWLVASRRMRRRRRSGVRSGMLSKAALLLLIGATAQAAPTFERDIAPLLYRYCIQCHSPGETGPFSLMSYDDAKSHATQIADLTRRRIMPPWLPEHGKGEFKDEVRLTEAQIQMFADWAAAGSPHDPTELISPPRMVRDWKLGTPDLIIEAQKAFS